MFTSAHNDGFFCVISFLWATFMHVTRLNKANLCSNHLLKVIKDHEREQLFDLCEHVEFAAQETIYEPGDDIKYTYFPCGQTLLAFSVLMEDAKGVEAALIGCEGALGGIISQGRAPAYCRASVINAGHAYRIRTADLQRLKKQNACFSSLFARYSDYLLAQVFQNVACNANHSLEQRLAKWILTAMERTQDKNLTLTHDQLANTLGVGRSYVGRLMSKLSAENILQSSRGTLTIHCTERLRELSCGCNIVVDHHFKELMADTYLED